MSNTKINEKLNQFTNSVSTDPYFYWLIFLKYKKQFILIPLFICLIVFFISKNIQPLFESKASLIIENKSSKIIDIDEVYNESDISLNQKSYINTQIEILKSKEIINRMENDERFMFSIDTFLSQNEKSYLKFLNLNKKKINRLEDLILNNLNVDNVWDSNIINITFKSLDSELSNIVLKKLIEVYLEYDIDQKISITTYASTKIQERLNQLLNTLEESEANLQSYKKRNQLIDLGDIKNLKTEEIKSLSSRILKAEKELQTLQNDIQQVKLAEDDIDEILNLKIIKDKSDIQKVKSDFEANENKIDSLLLIYKENHPKVKKAIQTSNNLLKQLDSKLYENVSSIAYEIANLQNFIELSELELEKSRKELQELEVNEIEMGKYIREVDLNRRVYESFLERLKETNEAKELQTSNAKVLDSPSLNPQQVFPNVSLNVFMSFIVSLIFLYLLIVYYETFRIAIIGPDVLENNDFNVLNIIPRLKNKKGYHIPINFLEKNNDKFSESIKTLETILLSKNQNARVLMISSPVSGEGKTTVSLNLALSLSTNSKVLFLETDLRRPSLMKSINLPYRDGLIELFNGQANFSDTVFNIYSSNLDILSAGRPSNFNNNINQNALSNFIEILKSKYDYIILDTAPILPVVDTLLVSKVVDSALLVVRSEFTKIASLTNARNKLLSVGLDNIDTVLNYFDTDNVNYYNYSNYGQYYKNYYNYS